MIKNALKMPKWFSLLLGLSSITISTCSMRLLVIQIKDNGDEELVTGTIKATAGSNFSLSCLMEMDERFLADNLVWGRRTKQLRFKNELDLLNLAKQGSHLLSDIQNENEPYHWEKSVKNFTPVQAGDRGVYFCMNLKYKLFKIVHIQVNESYLDQVDDNNVPSISTLICHKDKFRCLTSGICINSHYKCDGRPDCFDGSDEKFCHGNPCAGKIQCRDGRCIPVAWCCNQRTDKNCTVAIAARPSCCPPLPDPYDPIHWYNRNNHTEIRNIHRNSGSKYLFITICVISAVLSFVLFLFIISKVCGFDTKPSRRIINNESLRSQSDTTIFSCEHAECAIRRNFNPNIRCLYLTESNTMQNVSANNNNEMADPLIDVGVRGRLPAEISDQPPPYAEVVTAPPSIYKCSIDDLINMPPPPYSSTKFFSETEGGNVCASDDALNNSGINQSAHCDIARNNS